MALSTSIINLFLAHRRSEIDYFRKHPFEVQQKQLDYLLERCARTSFGRERAVDKVRSIEQFQSTIEICDYEAFSHLIARTKAGEKGVIWPSEIKWFAKSSGTTDAKSKYIPVSDESLNDSHMQGPRDVLAIFAANYPDTEVFSGKTLTLGGSRRIEREGETVLTGDLSAILIDNTPIWAEWKRVPSTQTALIPDFEDKVRKICEEAVGQNVTSFAGVPSWNMVLMNKILEYTGKNNMLEVWPNMELFVHGGMNFKPYREQYRKIFPSPRMKYMETYNASEGFFAIGDDPTREDMLLMLDYNTYYEFLPMEHLGDTTKVVPLEGVRCGVNYAMIISSSNGLWRYMIGDTVEFTSLSPHRIKITGRTKHFINAFGEEVVVDNAESAIRTACDATGAEIHEFSVAPIYMQERTKGAHQWIVEFRHEPQSLEHFTHELDVALQKLNSDYEAKRHNNTTLAAPRVTTVGSGTFHKWLQKQGKLGGQNKVPRLYNDRTYVEQLIAADTTND